MIPNRLEHSIPVIYKITNVINDKIYVGSAKDFFIRYQHYLRYQKEKIIDNRPIERAMKKWGFDYFVFSILEIVVDQSLLVKREQFWLDNLRPFCKNNGYNVSPTAYSCLGIKHSEETKKNMSKARKGIKASDECKRKMRIVVANRIEDLRLLHSRPVYQIHPDTLSIIAKFPSTRAASQAMGSTQICSGIAACCHRQTKSRCKFYWRWVEEYDKYGFIAFVSRTRKGNPGFSKNIRPILQLALDGTELAIWDSIRDAMTFIKGCPVSGTKISACCRGKQGFAYGYRWSYITDPMIIGKVSERRIKACDRFQNQWRLANATAIS